MKNVLVVDNHKATLSVMESFLITYDYIPLLINSYSSISDIIKERKPDIIIIEAMLHGQDGKIICKQIKEDNRNKNIIIILCSSYSDKLKDFKCYSADAILMKPFTISDLKILLDRFDTNTSLN